MEVSKSMIYQDITDLLVRTRRTFVDVCNELNIDPEWHDPDSLDIVPCDYCGYWEKYDHMVIDKDGTYYCTVCDNDNYFKFK